MKTFNTAVYLKINAFKNVSIIFLVTSPKVYIIYVLFVCLSNMFHRDKGLAFSYSFHNKTPHPPNGLRTLLAMT